MGKIKIMILAAVIVLLGSFLGCAAPADQNLNVNSADGGRALIYLDEEGRFSFMYPDSLELELVSQDDIRLNGENNLFIGIYVVDVEPEVGPQDPTLVKTESTTIAGKSAVHNFFEDPTTGLNSETVLIDDLHIVFSIDADYYQKNKKYFYQILDSLNWS